MKLRYYMRGLGIGILVTAILMGVTIDGKTEKMTDAEIIARAEALGMEKKYESTVLSETVQQPETEAVSENETENMQPGDEPEETVIPEETGTEETAEEVAEETVTEEEVTETEPEMEIIEETSEEDAPNEETAETVQITVQGGDGSQTVAKKLAQAGLVEDAKAYDKYLCNNGYDKRICTGTHTIPVGASEEEIAKIITSRP